MNRTGRRRLILPLLAGVLASFAAAIPAFGQADEPPVRGLIVRLKSAPAHEYLQVLQTDRRAREQAAALADAEQSRWQRVLGEAGLSGASGKREPRRRPVGRDQQLLEFERPLSRGEAAALREKLMQRAEVDWVEPNRRERRLQVPPTDPLFASQWWLQPVTGSNANSLDDRRRGVAAFQNAWARFGAPATPVVVAVLDTGITAHPDLQGRVLPGYDFIGDLDYANDGDGRDNDASDPGDFVTPGDLASPAFAGCAVEDSSWHGTIVAGMVAAQTNNGEGGAGVHWAARVLPVRVAGKCGADVTDIIDGMRWAAGLAVAGVADNPNPARIVSISFGGSAACGAAYQTAVDELRAHGAIVVAAAGNEWGAPSRPASCSGAVGVAGLNRDGFKTNYSNFGSALAASGIATVSGDDADGAWGGVLADTGLVTLTNAGNRQPGSAGYTRVYGTSFAVPQVSGTIALMLGLNPQLTHDQVLAGLRLSARPHVVSAKIGLCSEQNPGRCICTASTCGAGILDAEQALVYAAAPASYVAPQRQPAVIDNAEVDAALALAPRDREPQTPPVSGDDGGGGGAFGGAWLLGVAAAVVALRRTRRGLPP